MCDEKMVYLVDDDAGVLKSLGRLLQAEGLRVRTFQSAAAFLREHDPDVGGCVVLDMRLPDGGGLELQQTLAASGAARPVIFMTGYGEVADSVQAMKAGAVDFLTKPCDEAVLLAAIHRAIARDEDARRVRDELQRIRGRMASLTPREHEVLQQVVFGRLNKQIAADLGIAEKTIKVHRARAMEKMGASSLADLVRKTVELEAGVVVASASRHP